MDRIRIGLIGTGLRSDIANYWHQDERASVVAGCDIDPKFRKKFSEKYGKDLFITDDYRELLKRADVDAVAIFTPDNFHSEPAIAALEAGKDVFLEKPMAISIEACQRIRDAEESSGQKLMVGFNLRYNPGFNTVKEIIDQGTLGEIKAVWVRHFVNFGGWAYFHDYRASRKGSTSLLLQKASHDIDMIHYLTGEYTNRVVGMGNLGVYGGDKPNDLTCDVCDEKETCPDYSERDDGLNKRMCCYRKEVDVEDMSMLLMNLSGGVQASYTQCHYTPDGWRNYTIIGTKGRIEMNADETITVMTQKYNSKRRDGGFNYAKAVYETGHEGGSNQQSGHGGADPIMCRAFLDYLIDGVEPNASSYDALMSVSVGVKGAESLRDGNKAQGVEFS